MNKTGKERNDEHKESGATTVNDSTHYKRNSPVTKLEYESLQKSFVGESVSTVI